MKELWERIKARREELSYLIFGVLTTAVNYAVFLVLNLLWGDGYVLVENLIAWVLAVAFAYVTNKIWVFESRSWEFSVLGREIASFVGARLVSLGVEEAGLYIAAYVLRLDRVSVFGIGGILLAKLFLNVLVVILNYFFSKFLIFRKPSGGKKPD